VVEGVDAIVLWDMSNNKEIVNLPGMTGYSRTPKWSPDGSSFVINSTLSVSDPKHKSPHPELIGKDQELFRISREGRIERLTDFTSLYETVRFDFSSWSPDGRYVAFWVQTEPNETVPGESLAVWDSQTGQVTNYCIQGGWGVVYAPVWSPDSRRIVVGGMDGSSEDIQVFLIDMEQGYAVPIAEGLIPMGWMVKSP
jgi:Tol biopolymer transport system component